MFNALVGFIIASAIFTFWPPLGGHISVGIRNSWNWIKDKLSKRGPQE